MTKTSMDDLAEGKEEAEGHQQDTSWQCQFDVSSSSMALAPWKVYIKHTELIRDTLVSFEIDVLFSFF